MNVYILFAHSTILVLVLMFVGSWFMTFASRMMRSNDLTSYRKALKINSFSLSAFWTIWVCHAIWPGMTIFNRQIAATIAQSISLLLVFRYVKDVPLVKKVVIWFVWASLQICIVILALKWGWLL